ncbi:hypothetical protein HX99_05870 [Peptococcaceae bacterium SCADC1_2_3]|nr:hypothetical protein DK28_0204255 [Peptococcaceae bacterium SCADC1_2_3]KFI36930.1 hypothetical protein HX99_05870 [Peptococcaceae bacterium SCADC1_2_3]
MVNYIPSFKKQGSFWHSFDPRLKIIIIFCFIALISGIHHRLTLVLIFWILFLATLLARLSLIKFIRRTVWVLPLTGFLIVFLPFTVPGEPLKQLNAGLFFLTITKEGIDKALILTLRLCASLLALNLLVAKTSFYNLMGALRALKVPVIFVQLVEFTWRYLYVLNHELQRMLFARRARAFKPGNNLFHFFTFKTLGQLIGVLFMRSWERGERVYLAMTARGFTDKHWKQE